MNSLVIPLALLTGLVFAATGLSLVVLFYTTSSARVAGARTRKIEERVETALHATEAGLLELARQVHDLEQEPARASPSAPRPGFNLGKRTQALRMHRQGDSQELISATLEIPRQEVELLLKVHQIVLSTINGHPLQSGHPLQADSRVPS